MDTILQILFTQKICYQTFLYSYLSINYYFFLYYIERRNRKEDSTNQPQNFCEHPSLNETSKASSLTRNKRETRLRFSTYDDEPQCTCLSHWKYWPFMLSRNVLPRQYFTYCHIMVQLLNVRELTLYNWMTKSIPYNTIRYNHHQLTKIWDKFPWHPSARMNERGLSLPSSSLIEMRLNVDTHLTL